MDNYIGEDSLNDDCGYAFGKSGDGGEDKEGQEEMMITIRSNVQWDNVDLNSLPLLWEIY